MTKLNLSPDSKQLEKILKNRFLFEWYSSMIFEDYETEMNRFEFLALFTNPEGFRNYKEMQGKLKPISHEFSDGIQASKELEKFGIKHKEPIIEEGIEDVE